MPSYFGCCMWNWVGYIFPRFIDISFVNNMRSFSVHIGCSLMWLENVLWFSFNQKIVFFSLCRIDSAMLVEEGFEVVSVDASDKMLKYALRERWNRRREHGFDNWGTVLFRVCFAKHITNRFMSTFSNRRGKLVNRLRRYKAINWRRVRCCIMLRKFLCSYAGRIR